VGGVVEAACSRGLACHPSSDAAVAVVAGVWLTFLARKAVGLLELSSSSSSSSSLAGRAPESGRLSLAGTWWSLLLPDLCNGS